MNSISKLSLTALALAGLLSVSTTMAEAKGFSAGLYRIQEGTTAASFCLRANGTHFQTDGAVTGRWVNRTLNGTVTGFLWGNFPIGNGNLSVVALGVANSKATQWSDNNAFPPLVLNAARITKLSNVCPVLSPNVRRSGGIK